MAKKWALLVGIDRYNPLPALQFAGADARLLGTTLRETCNFSVSVITDQGAAFRNPLTNLELTRELTRFINLVAPEDSFLFFFAGHGTVSQGSTYLLGNNAEVDPHLARTRGLRLEDVEAILADIRARQKIVICDCCRANADERPIGNGPGRRGHVASEFNEVSRFEETARKIKKRGEHVVLDSSEVGIVLACGFGEYSYECPKLKQGVFTDAFAKALRQPAIAPGGEIVLGAVVESVRLRLDQWAAGNPSQKMNPLSITPARIVLGFYRGNGVITPQDPVRERRMERVDIRLSYKDLLTARQELLGFERNNEEEKLFQKIQMEIARQRPFRFTDGTRAETLHEWLKHLVDRPEDAANELADELKLSTWLGISLLRPDLVSAGERLHEPLDGQWQAVRDFAEAARIQDAGISQRLRALAAEEQEKIEEIERLIGQGNLPLASARLEQAMLLNPRSRRLQQLKELAQNGPWQDLIDTAMKQFESGEVRDGIAWLELAGRQKRPSPAMLLKLNGYRHRPTSDLESRVVYGLKFFRVPAGAMAMDGARDGAFRAVGLSSFWISRTSVCVDAFYSIMGWLPRFPPDDNPGFVHRAKPIVKVSWDDAASFCAKIHATLPTEAQWEYARRFIEGLEWRGLDEWCRDDFAAILPANPAFDPITDHGPNGSQRVVRRWSGNQKDRFGRSPEFTAEDLGFRCILPD